MPRGKRAAQASLQNLQIAHQKRIKKDDIKGEFNVTKN
jgi:hypothetical protein